MTGAVRTFVTRCSLVVRPVNLWTGRPPTGSALVVRLKESARAPIRTSDGSYAFLDYPGCAGTLLVTSPYYLTTEMPLDWSASEQSAPIVDIVLRPNRLYPAPAAATGFRFRVLDGSGSSTCGADVTASVSGKGKNADQLQITTWSDEQGFVVLPMPGRLPPSAAVRVNVAFGGRSAQAEWKTEPGSVIDMPDVRLSP